MKLTSRQIDKLLNLLGRTRDKELNCNECLGRVSEFAEWELTGKPLPAALQAVERHLEVCAECLEEYEALRRALEELPNIERDPTKYCNS